MIIKSKKTGMEQVVPKTDWEKMKKSGDYLHYQVVDRTDTPPEKPEPILVPEVREFIARQRDLQKESENNQEIQKPKPVRRKRQTPTN